MVEEKGKQAEEQHDEPRLWRPWRPPRRRMGWRVLWAVSMVVALLTTALLIVPLHPEIWKDLLDGRVLTLVALGFSLTAIVVRLAIAGARRSWTGFQGKTVWDFLQLLIVPLMLVAIGFWFTAQQDARQQKIEKQRAKAERELAVHRAQDEALQAYLSQMSQLMLDRKLLEAKQGDPVYTLARARTLTVLQRVDLSRKSAVLQFLVEADLVQGVDGREPIISLNDADLSDASLTDANLPNANLRSANLTDTMLWSANLSNAYLFEANLFEATLAEANLSDANLRNTNLIDADLRGADLRGADLSKASLSFARLRDADLRGADLRGATLNHTDLPDANLSGANLKRTRFVTNKELEQQAAALEGATMSNGQKYEDWLKSKREK